MKKVLTVLLSILLLASSTIFAFAEGDNTFSGELNIISFNVDGLPVPSKFSSVGRKMHLATRLIAQEISKTNCDILCAQEDFNLHYVLKNRLKMEYATQSIGGAGIGDGLNTFSKLPIYNVGRVEWEEAYGIFNCGSDELTPKGILYCTVEIADGVFVDVYNLHADACEDENSMLAKAAQFDQLKKLIEEHSGDRAVILAGDFNTNYSVFREGYKSGDYKIDLCQKLIDSFVNNGFKDAWVEANNGGNYDFTYSEMYKKYGCPYQRVWDTLDHIYYRDGSGVSFELVDAYYDNFDCDGITWNGHLSDHAAVRATLKYTVNPDEVTPVENPQIEKIDLTASLTAVTKRIFKTVFLLIKNIPELIRDGIGWIK